jgi:hypothetical protein
MTGELTNLLQRSYYLYLTFLSPLFFRWIAIRCALRLRNILIIFWVGTVNKRIWYFNEWFLFLRYKTALRRISFIFQKSNLVISFRRTIRTICWEIRAIHVRMRYLFQIWFPATIFLSQFPLIIPCFYSFLLLLIIFFYNLILFSSIPWWIIWIQKQHIRCLLELFFFNWNAVINIYSMSEPSCTICLKILSPSSFWWIVIWIGFWLLSCHCWRT